MGDGHHDHLSYVCRGQGVRSCTPHPAAQTRLRNLPAAPPRVRNPQSGAFAQLPSPFNCGHPRHDPPHSAFTATPDEKQRNLPKVLICPALPFSNNAADETCSTPHLAGGGLISLRPKGVKRRLTAPLFFQTSAAWNTLRENSAGPEQKLFVAQSGIPFPRTERRRLNPQLPVVHLLTFFTVLC